MNKESIFNSWNARYKNKYQASDVFCENTSIVRNGKVKKFLLKSGFFKPHCYGENCTIGEEWLGKPIVLQMDHINGINNDNRLENLRLLCPNCHSQTYTFATRNLGGKISVSDDVAVKALHDSSSIREALLKLNLQGSGGNYTRFKKLIQSHNITLKSNIQSIHSCIQCGKKKPTTQDLCLGCRGGKKEKIKDTRIKRPYNKREARNCEGCGKSLPLVTKSHRKTNFCFNCYLDRIRVGKKVKDTSVEKKVIDRPFIEKSTRIIVSRPAKNELLSKLSQFSILEIGEFYGVSDNAIRIWMRKYDIPTKKNDLKQYLIDQGIGSNLKWRIKTEPAKGMDQYFSKLTDDDIRIIREMSSEGMSHRKIAEKFNVVHRTIGSILQGKTWKHVE